MCSLFLVLTLSSVPSLVIPPLSFFRLLSSNHSRPPSPHQFILSFFPCFLSLLSFLRSTPFLLCYFSFPNFLFLFLLPCYPFLFFLPTVPPLAFPLSILLFLFLLHYFSFLPPFPILFFRSPSLGFLSAFPTSLFLLCCTVKRLSGWGVFFSSW